MDMERGATVRMYMVRALAVIFVPAAAGCATFTDYPRQMAPVRRQFEAGAAVSAADALSNARQDPLCSLLERGMMLHGAGQCDASNKSLFGAERIITEFDERAVISARDATTGAMTFVLNEKAAPYRGQGFERVLVNTYMAFNFLIMGDLTGARVEVRKAYERQQQEADRHARALEQARVQASSNSIDLDGGIQEVNRRYGAANRAAERVQNAYQNAFTYYLSSVVYELNGEINDAYIDCKSAIELRPDASCVRRDLIRFARRLGFHDEVAAWRERFGDVTEPPEGYGSILVVFEQGMVPVKNEVKLPIPTEFGILFVALPTYNVYPGCGPTMDISVDGRLLGRTQMMADIEGMAARDLHDKLPVLFVKQAIRTAAKGIAAKQLYDDDQVAGILVSTFGTLITEQADLRGWITLPRDIQVSRVWVRPTVRAVRLNIEGTPLGSSGRVEVPVESEKTTVVNARFTGRHLYVSVSEPLG